MLINFVHLVGQYVSVACSFGTCEDVIPTTTRAAAAALNTRSTQ